MTYKTSSFKADFSAAVNVSLDGNPMVRFSPPEIWLRQEFLLFTKKACLVRAQVGLDRHKGRVSPSTTTINEENSICTNN